MLCAKQTDWSEDSSEWARAPVGEHTQTLSCTEEAS